MRTLPRNSIIGQPDSPNSCWFFECWKRPLTFLSVLLALAFALSQLFGRFVQTDSMNNIKIEIRGLHSEMNQLTKHVDSLAFLQLEMDKRLKDLPNEMPQCFQNASKFTLQRNFIGRKEPDNCSSVNSLIEKSVQQAIATYDADDIGLADFALETAGGAVVGTPDTESYTVGAQPVTLFGIPLCYPKNTPQEMIKPGALPGECWAFKGGSGAAILRLLGLVNVSSISLEHIPPNISPAGDTSTAPREFSLWGINCEKDEERLLLGNFIYNNTRKPVQNFPVQRFPLHQQGHQHQHNWIHVIASGQITSRMLCITSDQASRRSVILSAAGGVIGRRSFRFTWHYFLKGLQHFFCKNSNLVNSKASWWKHIRDSSSKFSALGLAKCFADVIINCHVSYTHNYRIYYNPITDTNLKSAYHRY